MSPAPLTPEQSRRIRQALALATPPGWAAMDLKVVCVGPETRSRLAARMPDGNVVGLVVEGVVGGAVGIFTSGVVDGLLESSWDVGAALANGARDVLDSGKAVLDLAEQGAAAARNAAEAVGDGLSDAWESIFG
ncbi:hypothetical protein CHO01_12980 [Cellulomonas hominis]|uniref:Uncharacterized protein n=1 Tax=Cellulomonas hominis TaxID=156981 RepID=A0A511FAA8_9CELL|nr:hypothetical protein [Cellulomonas hominis]MBB5472084.1 hypothetical protein [Cellulomonas hominis]GEL46182.1 hypothetical protein CHO01_12980 [Cellulomonas hominis]